MADKNEEPRRSGKPENKIPVFTVLKNNCILKNIFLLDNPPSISPDSVENGEPPNQEFEEILVVGRHPDCNITLEHPSISRFHLKIYSKPYSQKLSVLDLSSVHGTWVSGKKIEPGVKVELNEGDTMRLGVSSRVYSLHWVPLSRVYDLEDPFVPPLDVLMSVEDEREEEPHQDDNCFSVKNDQIQTLSDNLEGLDLLFSDENLKLYMKKASTSIPPMPENMNISFHDEEEGENKSPLWKDHEQSEASGLLPRHQLDKENNTLQDPVATGVFQAENPESPLVWSEERSNLPSIWSRRGKPASVQIQIGKSRGKSTSFDMDAEIESLYQENIESGSISNVLFPSVDGDEEETFTPDKENLTIYKPTSVQIQTGKSREKSKRLNIDAVVVASNQENFNPSIQIQTCKAIGKSTRINFNAEVGSRNKENTKNESILRPLFDSVAGDEEETFTPDKENFTPNTLFLWSMKKMAKSEESRHSKSYGSSCLKNATNLNIHKEEEVTSKKENPTPKVLQEQKSVRCKIQARLEAELKILKSRADRTPFQSLLVNSTSQSKSRASVLDGSTKSRNSGTIEKVSHPSCNNGFRGETRRWIIVVDTNCLLNKDSRQALQLLRGLKGTQLIIPRIVVRELDCMKRRGSLFRKTTEVSSALQWIEDCITNTNRWIHVQSSMEYGKPIAPTPPTSPLSCFSQENGGFPFGSVPFSASGSLQEIVSPTAEDHILDCALLFRRFNIDGQLVLLSNDIALKIKAMAEGLICETAEEFRVSLVNPFSERFLWADSSPRGPTWSCADDIVLKEKYYPCPLKKLSKSGEGAKGLKLILLHNTGRFFGSVS